MSRKTATWFPTACKRERIPSRSAGLSFNWKERELLEDSRGGGVIKSRTMTERLTHHSRDVGTGTWEPISKGFGRTFTPREKWDHTDVFFLVGIWLSHTTALKMLDFCLLIACGVWQVFLNYVIKVIKQGYFKKTWSLQSEVAMGISYSCSKPGNYLGKSCLTCAFAFLHCLITHTPTLTLLALVVRSSLKLVISRFLGTCSVLGKKK